MGEKELISPQFTGAEFNKRMRIALVEEKPGLSWSLNPAQHNERSDSIWDTMTVAVAGEDVPIELIQQVYERKKSTRGVDAPCGLLAWLHEEPQNWNLRCRVLADEIVKILGLRTQQLAITRSDDYVEIYQQSLLDVDVIIEMLSYVPSLNHPIPMDYADGR